MARDPADNLSAVWATNLYDVLVTNHDLPGALAWLVPGYLNRCPNPSRQNSRAAIWPENALWEVWNDDRPRQLPDPRPSTRRKRPPPWAFWKLCVCL